MDEVKLAIASNIIKLRTNAGMTQAELGEKLNYSDKTISKWERAEAFPHPSVLKNIAELFNVSVDYLMSTHNKWEMPQDGEPKSVGRKYNCSAVTMLSITCIWTIAVLAFVIFWLLGSIEWMIFAYAVPVSLITFLVLNSIWHKKENNVYIVAALVLSIIAVVYATMLRFNPWQLFLVAVPAELAVFLGFRIRKKKK